MGKVKIFAMTALAAATIGVGGLAAAPTASAAPMSCSQALALSRAYLTYAEILIGWGYYDVAQNYIGKSEGVTAAAC